MKTKSFIVLVISVFILAVTATILAACDTNSNIPEEKSLILPEVEGDEIYARLPDSNISEPGEDMYEAVEYELPPESFVGTVLEETTAYMIVEPNVDEEEYNISKKIRVEYLHDHIDYLYGIGKKVVITYVPIISSDSNPVIKTDDIRHDGFEEFELSVQYKNDSIPARFVENQHSGFLKLIANNRDFHEYASDYNLYYYGLHDVYVTVDGCTLPLIEALTYGKVTIDGIIAECYRLNALSGYTIATEYKDGGSVLFDVGDYKILKYHTLDGNRDVYIGTSDMNINAVNATSLCITGSDWKDWGVRLEARDVTSEGATVVFKQKGGNVTGELQTGEAFWLERLRGDKWVAVDTLPAIDYAFHQVAYLINNNTETEHETTWKWIYGNLPEGQYRIAKEVMDFRETGDFDEQIYYVYFEIPEPFICVYPRNPEPESSEGTPLKVFDYDSLNINYEAPGVKTEGFINTKPIEIRDLSDVVTLAKNECTVKYDTVSIAVDIGNTETFTVDELYKRAEMYEINFSKSSQTGSNQTVYIDKYGVTKLIVYGE